MSLTWKPDVRGGWTGRFHDVHGRDCSLLQSHAQQPTVCLGLDSGGWMHLTRDQVNELLPHLARFVETGRLSEPGVST